MKNLTAFLFAGMLLALNTAHAQGFAQLFNGSNGWEITSSRYLFYINGSSGGAFEYSIHVKNTSASSKDIFCRRIYQSRLQGTVDYFCWGGQCLDSLVGTSPNVTTIAAGETNNQEFHASYFPNGNMGETKIQYSFYSNASAADTVSAFIDLISTPAGINEAGSISKLVLGPVPADELLNVMIPRSTESANLQLHGLDGRLIKQVALNGIEGAFNLDLSDVSAGTYTLSLFRGNVLQATNRLIVR